MKVALDQLRQAQPDVLVGSASALAWLTGFMTPEDRVRCRPRCIRTAGETCTAEMRRQLTETFGVPLYDEYASHEFNLIASECPQGGRYHIQEWNLILEVLDGERPVRTGEEGEVVATGLHSFAMPFIRYRLNDLVILGRNPCPCGAPVTTLDRILGRTIERFLLPDGRQVHPYVLVRPLLAGAAWLRRYQIVQDRPDHILVKIVPMTEPGPEAVASLSRNVAAALDAPVEVEVVLLNDIPPEPNGKYRPYYSLVSEQAQGRGA
jgi:phenylacetate-CoA ligase